MSNQIDNRGRRKAVKTILGGVTALAAYNAFPAKWGVPVIEQIFLPAHAATSGPIYYSYISGGITGIEPENNFMEMLADAGEAVSNFIVSEAHASPGAGEFSWYVTVIGDEVTVSSKLDGACMAGTGSFMVDSEIALSSEGAKSKSMTIDATVIEITGNTITIRVSLHGSSIGEVICTRSDTPPPACVEEK